MLFVALCIVLTLCSCTKVNNKEKEKDKVKNIPPVTEENPTNQISADVKITTEEVIPETRLSFIGVGDNIIYGTKEARIHASGTDKQYDYKPYYNGVADIIADADISFINQETLMCGEGYSLSYYPMFNSPQQVGLDLVELGFDVVNISNNHMLDKGADGLAKTIDFWKSRNVLMVGGYENPEDFDNIRILEKDGIKIAFLSYCEMTNGLVKSANSPVVVPYLDKDTVVRQTALANECADLVFVSVHWGDEGSFVPNSTQEEYALLFADCGVDVILGHHPHVIQPVEWLCGKDGNKTLCVYSLGNFMAQQNRDYNMVGGIIGFDIVKCGEDKPYVENPIFTPTVFHFNSAFTDNNVYLMSDYPKELASSHGVRGYYGSRFDYDTIINYAKNTIDSEFLPDGFFSQDTADTEVSQTP